MEIVKQTAILELKLDIQDAEIRKNQLTQLRAEYSDNKYIIINWHKSKHVDNVYVFDRFNKSFIQAVEQAIETNPFKHVPGINYEGQFIVQEIDDRFIDPKYYNIEVRKRGSFNTLINAFDEYLQINKDKIIDDLYNHILPH
jgi:hypothetical protein